MSIYFYNKVKIHSLLAKKVKHGAPHCKTWGEVGRLKVSRQNPRTEAFSSQDRKRHRGILKGEERMKFRRKGVIALTAALYVALFASAAMAVEVDNLQGLKDAIEAGGDVKLTAPITVDTTINVQKNIVLDLAGQTISASLGGSDVFIVSNGASMTIEDSAGNGIISSSDDCGIQIQGDLTGEGDTLNSKLVLNNGIIEADFYPVSVVGNGAQFDINGGVVRVTAVDGYAVSGSSGNAGYHGTIININGGELIGGSGLESDNPDYAGSGRDYIAGAGVFHSQDGVLNMTGGKVSGYVGIQFRSGRLNMTGGTVISNGDMPNPVASSNGAVAIGAGIAFITNGDPEKVGYRGNMSATISGDAKVIATGNDSYAIYEANHETTGNVIDTTQMKSLIITGGTFEGVAGALYIQNKGDEENTNGKVSISGGAFSSQPDEKYLDENVTFVDDGEGHFVVPSLTFTTDAITLAMNETITLDYTVVPANAKINWASNNPEIATVDTNGEITPAAVGETVITAALDGYDTISASCTVTVTEDDTPQQTGGSGGGCSAGFGALALLAALPLLRMRKK